ncbi:hypothetical protein F7725_018509 [Dissostichus mawsoni]|uniref:NR LBD domain-containing protein n=1 Tax=Dissostichus mawsoni TaxID=36200 RepID=A0A7J5XRR9_DISMA|nr:hypothetical protein F7725_018509 [Dissostichus mawsoni]
MKVRELEAHGAQDSAGLVSGPTLQHFLVSLCLWMNPEQANTAVIRGKKSDGFEALAQTAFIKVLTFVGSEERAQPRLEPRRSDTSCATPAESSPLQEPCPGRSHATPHPRTLSTIQREAFPSDMPCVQAQYGPAPPGSAYSGQSFSYQGDSYSSDLMTPDYTKLDLGGGEISAAATTSLPSFNVFVEGSYEPKSSCLYQMPTHRLIKKEEESYPTAPPMEAMSSSTMYFKQSPPSTPTTPSLPPQPGSSFLWDDHPLAPPRPAFRTSTSTRRHTAEAASGVTIISVVDYLLSALLRAYSHCTPRDLDYSQFSASDPPSSSSDAEHIQLFYRLLTISMETTRCWADRLPGFSELQRDDQNLLIDSAFLELFVLRMAHRSMLSEDKLIFCNGLALHRFQCLRGFGEWLDSIRDFATHLQSLNLDASAFACLAALVLLTEQVPGLKDSKRVEELQNRVMCCLRDHLGCGPSSSSSKAVPPLSRILSLRAELRSQRTQGLQRIFYLKLEDLVQPPPLIDRFLDTLPY